MSGKKTMFIIPFLVLLAGPGHMICRDAASCVSTKPEKVTINDNLSFIYDHDRASANSIVHIFFSGGRRAEGESHKGLAYLTAGLCVSIPDAGAVGELMQRGTTFSFQARPDYVVLTCKCLSENLSQSLKVLAGIIKKPLFSGLRINNLKRNMRAGQKAEADDPARLLDLTAKNNCFAGTGYSGSAVGDETSLKAIKRKDIVHFYKTFFCTANLTISVCTDLDKGAVSGMIKQYFSGLPLGESHRFKPMTFSPPARKQLFFEKDCKQSLVAAAARLPEINRENFILAFMLEDLLGRGIGSRLWHLRSAHELAYTATARVSQLKEAGILAVYVQTGSEKSTEARQALREVLGKVYRQGITGEELEAVKAHAGAEFLRMLESKDERALLHGYFAVSDLGFDFAADFSAALNQITLEAVNDYIKRVLEPGSLAEITIGREDPVNHQYYNFLASLYRRVGG